MLEAARFVTSLLIAYTSIGLFVATNLKEAVPELSGFGLLYVTAAWPSVPFVCKSDPGACIMLPPDDLPNYAFDTP